MRELVGELMLTRARLDLSASEFRRARKSAVGYQGRDSRQRPRAGRLFRYAAADHHRHREPAARRSSRMANLITELDGVVRELRMVPLSSLLASYPVAVHSLARELGREVRLGSAMPSRLTGQCSIAWPIRCCT